MTSSSIIVPSRRQGSSGRRGIVDLRLIAVVFVFAVKGVVGTVGSEGGGRRVRTVGVGGGGIYGKEKRGCVGVGRSEDGGRRRGKEE
jgi:hypothetical protein